MIAIVRRPATSWWCFLLAAVLLLASTTTAHALKTSADDQLPTTASELPPGDCWGGVLSAEPVHCYVLEESQREGAITVEAIYDRGDILYVYLQANRPELESSEGRTALFQSKARQYLQENPGMLALSDAHGDACSRYDPRTESELIDCLIELTFWGTQFAPWQLSYGEIRIYVGGAEARKKRGGWASWTQLWPVLPSERQTRDVGPPESFDISDVDLVNLPPFLCGHLPSSSCAGPQTYAEMGMAGWHTPSDAHYVQVKADSLDDPRAVAMREEMAGYKGESVIIPVKYSFEELWRWAVILNRFAKSSGNTIGILRSTVKPNIARLEVTIPMFGNELAERDDFANYREKVLIYAIDAEQAAAALPVLLAQLGIPTDAVGQVASQRARRWIVVETGQVGNQTGEIGDSENEPSTQPQNGQAIGESDTESAAPNAPAINADQIASIDSAKSAVATDRPADWWTEPWAIVSAAIIAMALAGSIAARRKLTRPSSAPDKLPNAHE